MFENVQSVLRLNLTKEPEELISKFNFRLQENEPLGKIRAYLAGNHKKPYTPAGVDYSEIEYELLAKSAITNWLPLISDTYTKSLTVQSVSHDDKDIQNRLWYYWQVNNLYSYQSLVHRAAIEYGEAFVLVLPSGLEYPTYGSFLEYPLITCYSPITCYAQYKIVNDTYPTVAVIYRGVSEQYENCYEVIDKTHITRYLLSTKGKATSGYKQIFRKKHGLGYVPIIKFTECHSMSDSLGVIAPLIPIQDRINDIVFTIAVAIQFASFRQKYAIGCEYKCSVHKVADAKKCNERCTWSSPFKSAPNTTWVSNQPDTKFGDFAQTQLKDHHEAYVYAVKSMASIAQIPAHILLGDMSNISVEALAAAESPMQKKINEYELYFGNSWSQVLALASMLDSTVDKPGVVQINWKDSEVRSLSQIADALGKIATMLGVPKAELWELIPGIGEDQLARWRAAKDKEDKLNSLNNILTDENREDNS